MILGYCLLCIAIPCYFICCMLLNNHGWNRSYSKTCLCKRGCGGFFYKKKKHSKVGGRRHAKTDCRINPLASKDKELEESWE